MTETHLVETSREQRYSDAQPYVLVLGTADWNQPIATNQHYVTREIGVDSSCRVTYMESMALRKPTLSSHDLRRILSRLRRIFLPTKHEQEGRPIPPWLTVRSPLVIPVHRGFPQVVNRRLLRKAVGDWLRYSGPKVLWTYSPLPTG